MRLSQQPLARGIYRVPWLDPDGRTMIVAVDSRGRSLGGPVRIWPGEDIRTAAKALSRVLDELDEVPSA